MLNEAGVKNNTADQGSNTATAIGRSKGPITDAPKNSTGKNNAIAIGGSKGSYTDAPKKSKGDKVKKSNVVVSLCCFVLVLSTSHWECKYVL